MVYNIPPHVISVPALIYKTGNRYQIFSFKCVLLCKETHKTCQTYHLITDRLSLKEQATVCIKQDQDRAQSIKSSDMHTVGIHHIGCHDNYGKYFSVTCRDVKTVYFSELVPVTERPIVSACYQSITCCFTAAVAHIPDARTPSQRNKGQWRIKAVGGRGNRCYAAVS